MSLDSLLLSALAPWRSSPIWWVAYSGGLDSTVLLHLLARLADRYELPVIRAIHVRHGLQVAADDWPAHCQLVCDELGVALSVIRVRVGSGASVEQAARIARYQAFGECLGEGELLLTGQHRDDQAETVLFRLLRGAGVRGLAAMPAVRSLGRGSLVRPLLEVSRADLEAYARANGLAWVEDPSNQQLEYSRNFLRRQVLPLLQQRWPRTVSSLARTAGHMAEAQQLLDELAQQDLAAAQGGGDCQWPNLPNLALAPLRELTSARQRNALRYWLAGLTLAPDENHWAGWECLRDARPDATPRWRLAGGELQRGGDRIWWLPDAWLEPVGGPVSWSGPDTRLALPDNGTLQIEGQLPSGRLQVRYRQGGESMLVPMRGRRDLKRLLSEAGVPTFVRTRLPLLYCDEELVAVANLPQLSRGGVALNWCAPEF